MAKQFIELQYTAPTAKLHDGVTIININGKMTVSGLNC